MPPFKEKVRDKFNKVVHKMDFTHGPVASYIAEFVGTMMLQFTILQNISSQSTGASLSIGSTLAVLIFALGNVSGGHFNPAVTLTVLLSGRCKIRIVDAIAYIVCQIFGALLGAFLTVSMSKRIDHLQPGAEFTLSQAMTLEVAYTTLLCYVVLNVATVRRVTKEGDPDPMQFAPLAIGFTVTSAAVAIGNVSGCSLNPAITIGLSALAHFIRKESAPHAMLYILAPLLGSVIASLLFFLVRRREEYGKGGRPQVGLNSGGYGAVPMVDEEYPSYEVPVPAVKNEDPYADIPGYKPNPASQSQITQARQGSQGSQQAPYGAPPGNLPPSGTTQSAASAASTESKAALQDSAGKTGKAGKKKKGASNQATPSPSARGQEKVTLAPNTPTTKLEAGQSVVLGKDVEALPLIVGMKTLQKDPSNIVEIDFYCIKFDHNMTSMNAVYFAQMEDENGIKHHGSMTEEEDFAIDSDEAFTLNIKDLDPNLHWMFFVATVNSSAPIPTKAFSQSVEEFTVRLMFAGKQNNTEFCTITKRGFPEGNHYVTSMLYYSKEEKAWKFKALDSWYTLAGFGTFRTLDPQLKTLCAQTRELDMKVNY